jgi:cell division transport system ATP-binding protein
VISFRSVTKVFPGPHVAVDGVDLEIAKGEFVFLVGPSGAGKTSLLRFIYREDVPTSGTVVVNGWDVPRLKPSRVPYLRRQIGVVFQDFRLLDQRTVYDNVAFTLRVTDVPGREIRRRVMEALEIVGLANKAQAMPRQLSGGEQQRVAIARAIVGRPLVVVADEPTGNLDPVTAKEILEVLLSVNRMGATVVMATHASGLVDAYRQRVVALERGRVVRDEIAGGYYRELAGRG